MRWIVVASLIAALVGAGCAGGDDDGPAGASGELVTISSPQQVARAFDGDAGRPRLVLLLSPT